MFHGPPGNDEPWLNPMTNNKGGSSGPPQRAATKRRKIEHAQAQRRKSASKSRSSPVKALSRTEDVQVDRGDAVQSPLEGIMSGMVTVLGQVGAALCQQTTIMQSQADALGRVAQAEEKKADAEELKSRVEALKLQLQVCLFACLSFCIRV